MDTIKIDRKNAKLIAHRGVCGLETENTAAAFIAAGNRNFYAIETDVQVTADGEFVLMHDDSTGRVADVDLVIKDTDYSVLRDICLKEIIYGKESPLAKSRSDLRIPTLSEYIRICKKYGKKCMIEFKGFFAPEDVDRVLELVEKEGYIHQSIFTAWDINALIQVRQKLPTQEIIIAIRDFNEDVVEILNKYSFEISLRCDKVSKEVIETAHANGRKVLVWYANTKEDAEKMAGLGVDYLVSNIFE